MGRRGMGELLQGFAAGQHMANAYAEASKKADIAKIAQEKESAAFTVQQGQELEALANAKDENGNPYYKLDANQDGTYSVTPNFKDQTGDAPKDYTPAKIAAKGVTYLGQNFDGPLTDTQKTAAKTAALAGVYEKHGDLEGSARVKSMAKQDRAADLSINAAESQERQTKRAEELQGKADAINQDVANYTSQFTKNPDGTDRQLNYDDHLHLGQYKVSKLMGAGLVDEASKLASQNMQYTANKIQVETAERDKALGVAAAAAAAGDLTGFKNFYNKYIPDGAQTTDISPNKDGKIVVSRVGADGEPMAPHTFKDVNELIAAAQSINKPEALYNYSNNEFHRSMQQKQLALQTQQVGISGAQLKMQQDERARQINKEKDAQAAGVALHGEMNPNASPRVLEAVRTGVIPAVQGKGAYKVESGDVTTLLGTPAVDAKGNPMLDPINGRQMVNRDNKREAEFFRFMEKNGITDTNTGLAKFLAQEPAGPAKPKDVNEATAQARAALNAGVPLNAVNAKLKELGYPPLN